MTTKRAFLFALLMSFAKVIGCAASSASELKNQKALNEFDLGLSVDTNPLNVYTFPTQTDTSTGQEISSVIVHSGSKPESALQPYGVSTSDVQDNWDITREDARLRCLLRQEKVSDYGLAMVLTYHAEVERKHRRCVSTKSVCQRETHHPCLGFRLPKKAESKNSFALHLTREGNEWAALVQATFDTNPQEGGSTPICTSAADRVTALLGTASSNKALDPDQQKYHNPVYLQEISFRCGYLRETSIANAIDEINAGIGAATAL